MDKLFLDANVLYSAAYLPDAGLARLWALPGASLITSAYAVAEAERNLGSTEQHTRLERFLEKMIVVDGGVLPPSVARKIGLPDKDGPIIAAAQASRCSHLITGDVRHFGRFYGTELLGVLVLPPAEYLRMRARGAGASSTGSAG
ncbi:MAG: DNA-binding protein [Trueperaceae bacterium]|nr:DNA-binding protein [Trueperaceae bacterium]